MFPAEEDAMLDQAWDEAREVHETPESVEIQMLPFNTTAASFVPVVGITYHIHGPGVSMQRHEDSSKSTNS